MNITPIGKGMCRIVVRSSEKRERLSRIPGVSVEGTRVIFPEWLTGSIRRLMIPRRGRKQPEPEQIPLFPDDAPPDCTAGETSGDVTE